MCNFDITPIYSLNNGLSLTRQQIKVNQIPTAMQHKSKDEKYAMDCQCWSEYIQQRSINETKLQLFT